MNPIKKQVLHFLIRIYNGKYRFLKIRKIIKWLMGKERIELKYENVNLLVGTQSAIENSILFDEYNEKVILNLIKYFSNLNYDFVDVGANVGVHSLTAAISNKEIQVFSFEPEPNNFFNFISNISLNRVLNIKPFSFGVGNKQEVKSLNINAGWNKGRHSLKMNFGENTQKINIPIISLDTFEIYFSAKNVMIKIDVEGFEKEVLQGANSFIKSINESIMIVELLEENNNVKSCNEIVQFLNEQGFLAIYKVTNNYQFKETVEFEGSGDYIFIKGVKTLKSFKDHIN